MEIEGVADYTKFSVINLFRRYNLRPNISRSIKEILETSGGLEFVDEYIFGRLREVIPGNYK